jgi:NAD-dependent dihydropyrimidine dehydrogenase PreA subunit
MAKPIVNKAKCTGCGTCVNVCPTNVFKIAGGKSTVINAKECIGCMACENSCPEGAIKVKQ